MTSDTIPAPPLSGRSGVPLLDGQAVAVRPIDLDRPGEANFVRMAWTDSFTFGWTPWPKLAEWERQTKDWQGQFKALVAGKLSQARLSRPRRKAWLESQKALIDFAVKEDPIFVACLADNPDVLLGFLACRIGPGSGPHIRPERDVAHEDGYLVPAYAYVSRRVRHHGIARFLVDSAGITPNPFVHYETPISTEHQESRP